MQSRTALRGRECIKKNKKKTRRICGKTWRSFIIFPWNLWGFWLVGFPAVTTQSEPFISIRIVHSITSMDPSFTIFLNLIFFSLVLAIPRLYFFFFYLSSTVWGNLQETGKGQRKKRSDFFFLCVWQDKKKLCVNFSIDILPVLGDSRITLTANTCNTISASITHSMSRMRCCCRFNYAKSI